MPDGFLSSNVIRTCGFAASLRAQFSPAKPPPTITTCFTLFGFCSVDSVTVAGPSQVPESYNDATIRTTGKIPGSIGIRRSVTGGSRRHYSGHQSGTCRFGSDPKSSVLDTTCKAHELDNLYVVDTNFFVSIGAVNPSLTAMANAIRVGDHLLQRFK